MTLQYTNALMDKAQLGGIEACAWTRARVRKEHSLGRPSGPELPRDTGERRRRRERRE